MASNKLSSILAEIDRKQTICERETFIELKSSNLIAAFSNLKQYIFEHYQTDDASDIVGRLLRAMEQDDLDKVTRKLQQIKIQESKNAK